jgi:hypothetical protein
MMVGIWITLYSAVCIRKLKQYIDNHLLDNYDIHGHLDVLSETTFAKPKFKSTN